MQGMALELTVVYTPDENGTWIAEILEIDGAFSYGNTKEQAIEMAFEAANLMLKHHGDRTLEGERRQMRLDARVPAAA